jgi:hypothetical protein
MNQGPSVGWLLEKEGQKSRDTVPLNTILKNRYFLNQWCFKIIRLIHCWVITDMAFNKGSIYWTIHDSRESLLLTEEYYFVK